MSLVVYPSIHMRFDQSLLYIAGIIKKYLSKRDMNLDELIMAIKEFFSLNDRIIPSMDVVYSIDLLYALNAVKLLENGKIRLVCK